MATRAQRKARNLATQQVSVVPKKAKSKRARSRADQEKGSTAPGTLEPGKLDQGKAGPGKLGQAQTAQVDDGFALSTPKKRVASESPGDRVVEAEFAAGASQLDQFPPPAFSEIAFAGRSNVGKSSLLNCLTNRKNLVRTSSTPGCTRQVSWFRTTSDDKSIIDLVDLPGYGYAKRSKTERSHWAQLIETFLLERPTLRGVVLLLDVRRGVEPDDLDLLEMLRGEPRTNRPPLELMVVATKMDKLPAAARKTALEKLTQMVGMKVYGFSSVSGLGKLEIWRQLRITAGVGALEPPNGEESSPAEHGP